jgi:CheY-like chemotaxis protein
MATGAAEFHARNLRRWSARPSGPSEEAPQSETREMTSRDAAHALAGVNVLVVEDEPDAREVVGALLEARGAHVLLTGSVAEATESLAHSKPDVIVSDIGMPEVDGLEFARRLRKLSPERGGDTPIVALTAYTSAQDRRRSFEAGYDCHLGKPVDMDELVRVLERLSKQRSRPS